MRLKNFTNPLFEAPLGNFGTQGFDQPEMRFREPEMKMIKRPTYLKKLGRAFRRTPFIFDIYMINRDQMHREPLGITDDNDEGTKIDVAALDNQFNMLLQNVPAIHHQKHGTGIEGFQPSRKKAIRVILMRNANPGNTTIPMTPWTVAHRIAHGIFDETGSAEPMFMHPEIDGENTDVRGTKGLILAMAKKFAQASKKHGHGMVDRINDRFADSQSYYVPEYWVPVLEMLMGTFRSARDQKLSPGEFIIECFAQYIVQGKVTLSPPSEWIKNSALRAFWTSGGPAALYVILENPKNVAAFTATVKKIEQNLNDAFKRILTDLQGHVLTAI